MAGRRAIRCPECDAALAWCDSGRLDILPGVGHHADLPTRLVELWCPVCRVARRFYGATEVYFTPGKGSGADDVN